MVTLPHQRSQPLPATHIPSRMKGSTHREVFTLAPRRLFLPAPSPDRFSGTHSTAKVKGLWAFLIVCPSHTAGTRRTPTLPHGEALRKLSSKPSSVLSIYSSWEDWEREWQGDGKPYLQFTGWGEWGQRDAKHLANTYIVAEENKGENRAGYKGKLYI